MKSIWKDILTALMLGTVLPGLLLNGAALMLERSQLQEVAVLGEREPEPPDILMRKRNAGGTVEEMELDTYLTGVVLAEMPAEFEREALKAQAVAARTYTLKAASTGGKHGDGSLCTQSSCCQAYIEKEDYLARGGTRQGFEKVRSAVEDTSGQVLTYGGTLIEATYFSCSGGSTEDAAAVWGTDFPYLQAVESPGEEKAAYHRDTVSFSAEEFCRRIGRQLEGPPADWFGSVVYTDGGGVESLQIGGEMYSGTQLRSLLGLRSTAFSVAAEGEWISIDTRGYGHRVGMSQYGADAMALSGSSCAEILAHYYTGAELTVWEGEPT